MGYVPQCQNDVFVSYRHVSNESRDRWVDRFCEELQVRLEELVGQVVIWRDKPELRAGDLWRPEIAEALDSAAVFIAIFSRTYLDSDVCRQELDRFLGRSKGAAADTRHPIIPIFKQPRKPDQELPQELAEIHRHEFFEWDPPGSNRFREYSPDSNGEISPAFRETLERLAQDLMYILEELKGTRQRTVGTIFLATVGPELHNVREKLRSDLQQRGYQVVPERVYFWNSADFKERVGEDLEAAELCAHLVGRTASIEPETNDRARLQLEFATEAMQRRGKTLPLIWLQPAEAIDDSARALIDYIERDLANKGVEILDDSFEEFKTQIYAKLPRPPSAAAAREVALLVEEGDLTASGEIITFLVKVLGLSYKRITFAESLPRDPLAFGKTLGRCDKCLLFWGGRSEEWLDEVLSLDALASLGEPRLCIYAAAPATPEKETFLSAKARMISGAAGTRDDELRNFLLPKEAAS